MNTVYFNPRMTAEKMQALMDDLKSKFRKLIQKYHPDINPNVTPDDLKYFKEQNNIYDQQRREFAYWYARAATEYVREKKKDEHKDNQKKTEYYENHYDRVYIDSLEKMLYWLYEQDIDLIDGIVVELIGVFIWIGGVKPEHRNVINKIKSVGFQGSWKKDEKNGEETKVFMWKWTPKIARFDSEEDMRKIRGHYGSEVKNRKPYQKTQRYLKG